jgi:hypothetical protein
MSVMYCDYCGKYIDTDFDLEHFDEDMECLKEQEDIENYINEITEDETKD